MNENSKPATRVITPNAVLSYPHLDAPVAGTDANAKAKYSVCLIFPAGTNIKSLEAAALAAGEAKWPGKVQGMIAASRDSVQKGGNPSFRLPFRRDGKPGYPENFVCFINARSTDRPGMVYAHAGADGKRPETVPLEKIKEVFYPGAVVRAAVTAFAYDTNGNKGIAFAVNNVQKVADGERLDSRVAADDEFEVDLSAAPADLSTLLG